MCTFEVYINLQKCTFIRNSKIGGCIYEAIMGKIFCEVILVLIMHQYYFKFDKEIFMKRMSTEIIEKINIVDNYLTLILFISTIVMILLHFSTKFNVIFAVVFCVFLVLNWFSKPLNYNNSIDIILLATELCGNMTYIIGLFFILGRIFINKF